MLSEKCEYDGVVLPKLTKTSTLNQLLIAKYIGVLLLYEHLILYIIERLKYLAVTIDRSGACMAQIEKMKSRKAIF